MLRHRGLIMFIFSGQSHGLVLENCTLLFVIFLILYGQENKTKYMFHITTVAMVSIPSKTDWHVSNNWEFWRESVETQLTNSTRGLPLLLHWSRLFSVNPCFSPGSPYYYSATSRGTGPTATATASAYDRHWPGLLLSEDDNRRKRRWIAPSLLSISLTTREVQTSVKFNFYFFCFTDDNTKKKKCTPWVQHKRYYYS